MKKRDGAATAWRGSIHALALIMTVSRGGPCVGQRETSRARTNSRQARRILVQGEPVALASPWVRRLHPRTAHGRWYWYLRAQPVRSGATGRSRERCDDRAASAPTFKPPRCTVSPPLPSDLGAVTCIVHCRPSLGPASAAGRRPNRAKHNPTQRPRMPSHKLAIRTIAGAVTASMVWPAGAPGPGSRITTRGRSRARQGQENSRAVEASPRFAAAPRAEPCARATRTMLQARTATTKARTQQRGRRGRGAGRGRHHKARG